MPIADDAIDVSPGAGKASLVAEDLSVPDYGDFLNALLDGPSTPASVSFAVHWHGVESRYNAKEPDFDFAGEFAVTSARMEWSAEQAGFSFQSAAASASASVYALVGHERNGVFF